jgi:hypothetical protein
LTTRCAVHSIFPAEFGYEFARLIIPGVSRTWKK